MLKLSELTAEKLANDVMSGSLRASVYYLVISGRKRLLEILRKQNPLFFRAYTEIGELNDSQLTEFLVTNIKGTRIVVKDLNPDQTLIIGSDATQKAIETKKVIDINSEVSNDQGMVTRGGGDEGQGNEESTWSKIWKHVVGTEVTEGPTKEVITTKTKTNYTPVIIVAVTIVAVTAIVLSKPKKGNKKSK